MNLTPEQTAAIEAPLKPLQLITALAGTGKTTVAAARIKHLIDSGTDSATIYAITFTRAGGNALREKVGVDLGWSGTLHSFAMHFLGISPQSILTDAEERELLDRVRQDLGLTRVSMTEISAALASPRRLLGNMGLIARTLQCRLDAMGKMTFDLVLRQFLEQIREPKCRVRGIVMVDEAQDTSAIDEAIYHTIATHLIVVGDMMQSIYAFRGATGIFMDRTRFRCKESPDQAAMTPLTVSFRCSVSVCALASKLLPVKWGYRLETAHPDVLGRTWKKDFENEREEESFLIDFARENRRESLAILCRFNRDVDRIRRALQSASIEIQPRVFGQQDSVESAMARFLRLIADGNVGAAVFSLPPNPARDERWPSPERLVTAIAGVGIDKIFRMIEAPVEWLTHPASKAERPVDALRIVSEGLDRHPPDSSGIFVETIHGAKGREWDRVVLAACNDDLDSNSDGQADNRVYVAITRARADFGMTRARFGIDPWTGHSGTTKPSKYLSFITD